MNTAIQIGSRQAAQVALNLEWEFDTGRAEDWRLDENCTVPAETMAAESRVDPAHSA